MKQDMFDGSDYAPARDNHRLTGQLRRVWAFMSSGNWETLASISSATGDPAPSVSAQLRHLRKPRFGGHTIQKQYEGAGLYTYRLLAAA